MFRRNEAIHLKLVERICQQEANILGFLKRKLTNMEGDMEIMITEAVELAKRTAEDALKRVIADEKRDHLFTDSVLLHVRELERSSNSSSGSSRGATRIPSLSSMPGSNAIYRSSTSSRSSVFLPAAKDNDEELIEAIDLESVRMAKAINDLEQSLERVKERLGEKFV